MRRGQSGGPCGFGVRVYNCERDVYLGIDGHYPELREELVSSDRVYTGKIIGVDELVVRLPSGGLAGREVVRHVGAVAIVPLGDDGRVTLVRQYRAPLGELTLEIPAGKYDYAGEDALSAARRELLEETGLSANRWERLTSIATTPGFADEIITIFLARGLTRGEASPDEDEFINVEELHLQSAVAMAVSGEIIDSKTVCGLLLAERRAARDGE